jgi:hypothetical protein
MQVSPPPRSKWDTIFSGPSQFKLFLISVQQPLLCEPGTQSTFLCPDNGQFLDTVAICLDLSAEL